jgi:hypothetical protein
MGSLIFWPVLPLQDAFSVIVGSALVSPRYFIKTIQLIPFVKLVHLLFKRYEFQHPLLVLLLLGLLPSLLGTLLVPYFPSFLAAALVSFATYLSALVLSIAIYRAAPYHPLARYPGPFLNKLSKFRMVGIPYTFVRSYAEEILGTNCLVWEATRVLCRAPSPVR